ncbi:hypothetical protein NBO_24g0019, partial [Nosema bombycis CQ1]
MLATATFRRDNKRDQNNKKQSVAKRTKYQVEIELKDDSSDSLCSNFNRNVDEFAHFIEGDSTMQKMSPMDVIQSETADLEENISPPDFKEVKKVFEEVFIEFNKSLENEQTIKKETLILEDSSSSVEFVESGDVNGSKQDKIKDKCVDFEKEVIILVDSSSSVEIMQNSNDNLALLTIESTQNSSEGLDMLQEDLNRINKAYNEQIFENNEECSSKEHMINNPIENQTILTKNLDSRAVQEPIEDFLNNLPMNFDNINYTQDQQCMFKGYNTEMKISHDPDNEIIADELHEIQEYFFQNFNEEMNKKHLVSENGINQSITNDELVCETIDENVRKIRELLDQIIDEEIDQQHDTSFN